MKIWSGWYVECASRLREGDISGVSGPAFGLTVICPDRFF